MSVAIYLRVSTTGQNEEGQRREIQRWLDGNGIQHVQWYLDKDTGDRLDRKNFNRLQQDIFGGRVKTVVVYKLDRLSRSLKDGLNVLCDWCEKGVRVVSVTQCIDFNGTVGRMIAAVLLGVAEMEQSTRRERQAAGIAVAKEKGKYKGRKPGTTKADAHRAVKLRGKGLTQEEIAQALGVSISSVRRYLKAH